MLFTPVDIDAFQFRCRHMMADDSAAELPLPLITLLRADAFFELLYFLMAAATFEMMPPPAAAATYFL